MTKKEDIKTSVKTLQDDELIKEWFSVIQAADNTRRGYLNGMALFCEFTKMTPSQLLAEAEAEIKDGLLARKRSIRQYLLDFRESLNDKGFAPKTTHGYMAAPISFYKSFDIDVPKLNRRKGYAPKPTEKNTYFLNKEQIRGALKFCDIRNKAIILTMSSSGLSQVDLLDLKVGQFQDGYDEKTGITTLRIRRKKTKYDFITFISPEASDVINDYLEWRNREPKRKSHTDIMRGYEKRRVRSDNDYLFIKSQISDDYLKTPKEEDRKLDPLGLMQVFRTISKKMGLESEDEGRWGALRSHNFRKYFNSTLLNNGGDIFFTDYLMGHVVDQTHEAYFKADPEKLRERYMRFVPHLSIEEVEARVLTSDSYEKLTQDNERLMS